MADNIRKLIKKRSGHRGDVTSTIKSIDSVLGAFLPARTNELQGLRAGLVEKFERLRTLDEAIYNAMTEDDNVSEEVLVKEAQGASELFIRLTTKFHDIDEILSGPTSVTPRVERAVSISSSGTINKVKLPKIELQRFSGDAQKWKQFWDSFDSLVNSNEDLSDVDKFYYLRSVLSGEAMGVIEGFPPTKENYAQAVALLKERFGNASCIISSHMDAILKLPNISAADDTKGVRKVYDRLETHIRSLQALGIDSKQFGPLLVPVLLDRLPAELSLIISRQYDSTKGDVWELNDVLSSLKKEIEARERSGYVSANSKDNKAHRIDVRERGKFTGHALLSSEEGRSVRLSDHQSLCVFCNKSHKSENCRVVSNLNARREHLRKSFLCFNCLKSGHHSKHCRSHNRCITCHGKHHNAICFSSTNQGNDRKSPRDPCQVAKPEISKKLENTEAVPIAMICNSATSVLMQTGRALVSTTNGNHFENVRVIFDSGSQRS